MAGIDAIKYPISNQPTMTAQQRKENQEKVAAGVGGAAGLSTSATKMASKKALQAESALAKSSQILTETNAAVIKSSEATISLWTTFKSNIKMYKKDILNRLDKFKDAKFIGPILKSPIIKKAAGLFGGALAFFVLITGVNKAVKTGAIARDHFQHQFNEMRNI